MQEVVYADWFVTLGNVAHLKRRCAGTIKQTIRSNVQRIVNYWGCQLCRRCTVREDAIGQEISRLGNDGII